MSKSKSSLNISSKNSNSSEHFPRSILRKTGRRYDNNSDGNSPTGSDASQKERSVSSKRSKIKLLFEKDESSHELLRNDTEEILVQNSPSSILRNKVCGAQFPLLDNNNNTVRDLNNNEFSEESNISTKSERGQEEYSSAVANSKHGTKSEEDITLRLQEGLHCPPTLDEENSVGGEIDKIHSSPSLASTRRHLSSLQQQKKIRMRAPRKGVLALDEQIQSRIFSYLNRIEIHTCTQVCRFWKELCDTLYYCPSVFNGRDPLWKTAQSKENCRLFLTNHLLTSDHRRRYKLYFYNVEDWQMRTIMDEHPKDFLSSVRHITKLHLVNCNLQWQTFLNLLMSLHHLHTFTDTWSCHFLNTSCFPYYRLNTEQGSIKKVEEKLALNELKTRCTRIRIFKISRRSFTKELCIYFHILPRFLPYLEVFEFNLGPWKTPKSELPQVLQWLDEFGKIFKAGLRMMRKSLKRLRFYWDDSRLANLFDKCVGAIYSTEFPRLVELTIRMSASSMKHPGKLPEFVRFINSFQWKEGGTVTKNDMLILNAYIAPIFMTKEWVEFLCTFQDRIIRRKSRVSLRFEVQMDDSITSVAERTMIADAFRNFVFFRGLTKLQVSVHNEQTQSLREVIPGIRTTFPNIKCLDIRIGEGESGSGPCFAFRDYSVISIAFNFKFITELRISDHPGRRWDVLDRVVGRKRTSLTYAYITARDMVLLCETLTRLRILKLWANLNDLRDINFTGIRKKYYYFCPDDGNYYLRTAEVLKEKREPSIYNLKNLQLLSLRGLGKDVTDITCRFAFQGMKRLKYIELTGDTSITQKGRQRLHSRMSLNECKVNFCR